VVPTNGLRQTFKTPRCFPDRGHWKNRLTTKDIFEPDLSGCQQFWLQFVPCFVFSVFSFVLFVFCTIFWTLRSCVIVIKSIKATLERDFMKQNCFIAVAGHGHAAVRTGEAAFALLVEVPYEPCRYKMNGRNSVLKWMG